MKNLARLLCVVLLSSQAWALDIKKVDRPLNPTSFLGYVPNQLIVVMRPEAARLRITYSANAVAQVGEASLDALAQKHAVSGIRMQFPGSDKMVRPGAENLARFYEVRFEKGTLDEVMAAYASNPLVESVEPIGMHTLDAVPNDNFFSPYQWYHTQASDDDIDTPEAWDLQDGEAVVAVFDSGTRYYHPDLGGVNASPANPTAARGNMWINTPELNGTAGVDDDGNGFTDDWIGWDFVSSASNCWSGEDCTVADNDPRDFNGHGTHCAGIVGMLTNNGYGMAGTAGGWGNGTQQEFGNGCKVMGLRIGHSYNNFGQEVGVVYMNFAASAFYYAAAKGVKIASCSWGSSNSGGIAAAIDFFLAQGGLIFKAAGNANNEATDYMTARADIISVAATDETDNGASFTSYGTWVDISAPGNNIYATYHDHLDPNTNYWASLSGTSMATPMTAAVAGLIWSQNPGWTATQVRTQLFNTADNITSELAAKYVGKMGVGRINAYAAVNTGPPPAPVANFTGTPTSGTAPLNVAFTSTSTGSITSYSWTFGDGGTSTLQNPSYNYAAAGTYDVSLTVTGPGGSDGETKVGYITVNPCVAPVANFSGTPTSGTAPLNVNFTDLSTGSPTSWSWDFGDGGNSASQNPAHSYASAGSYTVTLTATNGCGSDGETKTAYITVSAPAWTTITSDNFETNFGSYTDGGTDCVRYTGTTHSHQGAASIDIQDNTTTSLFSTTTGRNVSGYTMMEVDFWFKMVSMENNENFWLQYSSNGGTSWQTVANFVRTAGQYSNNTFYHAVISMSSGTYNFSTNAKLRFRCDASNDDDDVYIDEVVWRGLSGGSAASGPEGPLASGVEEEALLPGAFVLDQNYPNPFNPTTSLAFELPEEAQIRLDVFNILGQQVANLANGHFPAGRHEVQWNARGMASGVYFYRLQAGAEVQTRSMMLLK